MRGLGILTRSLVTGEIQFSPPRVIAPEQVKEFASAVLNSLEVTSDRRALVRVVHPDPVLRSATCREKGLHLT